MNRIVIVLLGVILISGHAMEDEAPQGYKLEGIFTTKITALAQLNPDDYKTGDIAVFGCEQQWYTLEKKPTRIEPNLVNIAFLNTLKDKGIPCFCMNHRNISYDVEDHINWGVKFSDPFEKDKILDEFTVLSHGYLKDRLYGCFETRPQQNPFPFYPHQKITSLVKSVELADLPFQRILYFCDDLDTLSYLTGRTLSLPAKIYYAYGEKPLCFFSHYYPFILSDQPQLHWVFTQSPEDQIAVIRQNPLILANTFVGWGNKPITYGNIIAKDILYKAFDRKAIIDPSPLLKTFLMCPHTPDEFARWLMPLYDETIWTDVVTYADLILKGSAESDVDMVKLLIENLVELRTSFQRAIYVNDLTTLFSFVLTPSLRQSVLDSYHMIPREERDEALERGLNSSDNTELGLAAYFAERIIGARNRARYIPKILTIKSLAHLTPFDFIMKLKTTLKGDFASIYFEQVLFSLKRYRDGFVGKFSDPFQVLADTKLTPPQFVSLLNSLGNLVPDPINSKKTETNIFFQVLSVEHEIVELPSVFTALSQLFDGIVKMEFSHEIDFFLAVEDPETRLACASAANILYRSCPKYREVSLFKDYLHDLLKGLMGLSDNQERQKVADDLSGFLAKTIKQKQISSMGQLYFFNKAIQTLLTMPNLHRACYFDIMRNVSPYFHFAMYQQITRLAEDMSKLPLDQLSESVCKTVNIGDVSGLRIALGLPPY